MPKPRIPIENLIDHLDSKIFPDPNTGCWFWMGGRSSSGRYGSTNVDGKNIGAHRLFYQLYVGAIPEKYEIDHLCNNRLCVNPLHLEAVTGRDNVARWIKHIGKNSGIRARRRTRQLRTHEDTNRAFPAHSQSAYVSGQCSFSKYTLKPTDRQVLLFRKENP